MMKSKISFICTAAILLIVTSCSGRQGADAGLISVRYDRLPHGDDILLSDWVGEPEFIALDSSDPEAIIAGGEVTVSDRHIGRESTPEYLSHR